MLLSLYHFKQPVLFSHTLNCNGMQFTINIGTDYSTVKFTAGIYNTIKFKLPVIESFENSFSRLGGIFLPEEEYVWKFPSFITSQVLQEVIHNTCFVCGGLMKDYEYHSDHIVRKCQSCGHSHT